MSLKEINEILVRATRPFHVFGDITEEELNKKFRALSKLTHPDKYVNSQDKYIAEMAFRKLNDFYELARKEFQNNIYKVFDPLKLYENMPTLFEFNIGSQEYKFYEYFCKGEVANLYKGTSGDNVVYLKVAIDQEDNELIENEIETLARLNHSSLPILETNLNINDLSAFIMRECEGLSAEELKLEFKNGVPDEHVMWMLERLFSVAGYLHSNYIVHGNIKPEHIIINPENHNVSLIGFSMCIPKANSKDAKYKIVNEYYTSPEISLNTKVLPNSDIYSIGKSAVYLLGGNVYNNGLPINMNYEIRDFIRKISNPNPNLRSEDAWQLWDEIIDLRNKIYGTERFKKLERKI